MHKIQLPFTIFFNKTVFYFLVQHMLHFLLETFPLNERTFSYGNCKVNEKKTSLSV